MLGARGRRLANAYRCGETIPVFAFVCNLRFALANRFTNELRIFAEIDIGLEFEPVRIEDRHGELPVMQFHGAFGLGCERQDPGPIEDAFARRHEMAADGAWLLGPQYRIVGMHLGDMGRETPWGRISSRASSWIASIRATISCSSEPGRRATCVARRLCLWRGPFRCRPVPR